jgi:serine phosphatase RsbU (regulator of sigma subunit)
MLDPAQHTVTLVSAGHMLPLLYRRAPGTLKEALPLSRTGLPLGVQKDIVYTSHVVELEAGDCLLQFTDGLSDSVNVGGQTSQIQGIHTVLRGGGPYTPQSLGQRLLNAIEQQAVGRSQLDDITLVCFGRVG